MKVKIEKVAEFNFGAGKTGYNIFDTEGNKYTTFSSTIATEARAAALDEKEREIEFTKVPNKNPNYPDNCNITSFSDASGKPLESTQEKKSGGFTAKADPVKQASIERQNAMNSAVTLYTAFKPDGEKINPDELIAYAETILAWTSKKGDK